MNSATTNRLASNASRVIRFSPFFFLPAVTAVLANLVLMLAAAQVEAGAVIVPDNGAGTATMPPAGQARAWSQTATGRLMLPKVLASRTRVSAGTPVRWDTSSLRP